MDDPLSLAAQESPVSLGRLASVQVCRVPWDPFLALVELLVLA